MTRHRRPSSAGPTTTSIRTTGPGTSSQRIPTPRSTSRRGTSTRTSASTAGWYIRATTSDRDRDCGRPAEEPGGEQTSEAGPDDGRAIRQVHPVGLRESGTMADAPEDE